MHLLVQTLVGQLSVAGLYALIGVGFVTIYRTTSVLNLAQGSLSAVGGYLCLASEKWLHLGFWASSAIGVVGLAALGFLFYTSLFRPLLGRPPLYILTLTLIINVVIGALILLIFGAGPDYPTAPQGFKRIVHLPGGYRLTYLDLGVLCIAVILIATFAVILRYSSVGTSMRAVAENQLLASHRGINVAVVSAGAWAIALAFGGIAGIAYGANQGLSPGLTALLGFAVLPAVILGGLDSVIGALVGAIVLAEAQGVAVVYGDGGYGTIVGYIVVLIVLVIKPRGLFSRPEVSRL